MTKVKLAVLAAVILTFQFVAFADSTGSFDNQGGDLVATEVDHSSNYVLSVSNSPLSSVSGVAGLNCGGYLGTTCSGGLGYKLPATSLSAINNVNGAPLDFGAGGSFTIRENGATVFSGSFVSLNGQPAAVWTWTGNTATDNYQWTLTGTVSGTYTVNGQTMTVDGALVQLTVSASSDPFSSSGSHSIRISGGNANLPGVVPESGTLLLFGTGLIGVALVARRKYLSGVET